MSRALEQAAEATAQFVLDDLKRRFGGGKASDLIICTIAQVGQAMLRPIDPSDLCHIVAEAYGAVAKAE